MLKVALYTKHKTIYNGNRLGILSETSQIKQLSLVYMCTAPVVYSKTRVLFTLFVFACGCTCVQHILCCVFCLVCLCPVFCVPNIASYSGLFIIKDESLLTIGYTNFSHVTIVFIAKYLFTGSVKILNKIVFKIAITFISMRNPEISYCLYSEKFK